VEGIEQAFRLASKGLVEHSQYDRVSAFAIYFSFILISLSAFLQDSGEILVECLRCRDISHSFRL
jgi:hypothetical protein